MDKFCDWPLISQPVLRKDIPMVEKLLCFDLVIRSGIIFCWPLTVVLRLFSCIDNSEGADRAPDYSMQLYLCPEIARPAIQQSLPSSMLRV